MPEAPQEVSIQTSQNKSMLVPLFNSDRVEVHTEQLAFSFISLVADIGGVLGLFIGFNFLMVWDWIAELMRRFIPRKFDYCKSCK